MRYGLNLLLWTDALNEEARPLLDEIKQLGFDAVEVPVFEIDVPKYAQWGKYLDNAGLARTAVTIRGADDNPMSCDPGIRRKGIDNNKAALDCAGPSAPKPSSARTIRRSAASAAPDQPAMSGIGPSTACDKWPTTPNNAASCSGLNTSTASNATCSTRPPTGPVSAAM